MLNCCIKSISHVIPTYKSDIPYPRPFNAKSIHFPDSLASTPGVPEPSKMISDTPVANPTDVTTTPEPSAAIHPSHSIIPESSPSLLVPMATMVLSSADPSVLPDINPSSTALIPGSTLTSSLEPSYLTNTTEMSVSMATNDSISMVTEEVINTESSVSQEMSTQSTLAPMATGSTNESMSLVNMTTQSVAMVNDSLVSLTTQSVTMENDSVVTNGSVTSEVVAMTTEMGSITTEAGTTVTPPRDLEVVLILDGDCAVVKATKQKETEFKNALQVSL